MMAFHVLPVDDLREHDETPACWCKPRVLRDDPDDANEEPVIVHNSLDGRELVEEHGIN